MPFEVTVHTNRYFLASVAEVSVRLHRGQKLRAGFWRLSEAHALDVYFSFKFTVAQNNWKCIWPVLPMPVPIEPSQALSTGSARDYFTEGHVRRPRPANLTPPIK